MTTIDYKKLMDLGYKEHTARCIIRQAKVQLVNDGYGFYSNQRLGIVPTKKVEEILNIDITEFNKDHEDDND